MKITVIITTVLIAQVSASFFDVFQGAVLSVQNSFGKLLSDVVTDVRETVDCTILAVEHVLSLSEDATARYYEKCGSGTNKTNSGSDAQQDANLPKVEVSFQFHNNEEYLNKQIPSEIDSKINETLSKMLGNYNPHKNILSVENVLAKESEKLAGVSNLVKEELEKLSNEVHTDFKNIKQRDDSEPSVDTILHEIKLLENREQNTKNTSEANEIHQVIDEVLDKLDAFEATEATEDIKLEEILKELESNSNNSFVGLRKQFKEWKEEESRHLGEIKNKMEEHERIADLPGYNRHESNHTQPVQLDTTMHEVDIKPPIIIAISSLKTGAAVKQESNDDSILNSVTNITSTDKDSVSETTINSQVTSSKEFSTQVKEILDSTTSPRTVVNSTDGSSTTTTNEPESISYPLNNTALNETVVISTSSTSTTGSTFVSEHNSTNSTENYKPLILSTNQSTAVQNKGNVKNSNDNDVTSTPISSTDNTTNDTSQTVKITTDSYEQKSLSLTTNEPTTIAELIHESNLNGTVVTSNAFPITESKFLSEVTDSVNYNTDSRKKESTAGNSNSAITPNTASDKLSNDTIITSSNNGKETEITLTTQDSLNNKNSNEILISSTAIPIFENTSLSATVDQIESMSYSENGSVNEPATIPTTINDNHANDTMITITPSSINVSKPVSFVRPEETTHEFSAVTINKLETASKILNDTGINDTMKASLLLPIVNETTQHIETVDAPDDEDSSTVAINELESTSNIVNDAVITSTPLPPPITPILSTPKSETFLSLETTEASGKDKSSTEAKNESSETINNSPSLKITPVSEIIQPLENTLASANEESPIMTTNKPIATINTADDDDSNATEILSTSVSIPENIPVRDIDQSIQQVENTTTVESEELSTLTAADIIIDTHSTDQFTTSASSSTENSTLISGIMQPVESTTSSKNEEPSKLSINKPADIEDKVTNDDSDSNVTVSNTDSSPVNENIQPVRINKHSKKQESATTSASTTLNIIVTKSNTPTLIIPTSETISPVKSTTSRNEYRDLSTLVTEKILTTPIVLNNYDLNHFMTRSPPLTITDSPLVNKNIPFIDRPIIPENREWLTPNKFIPLNYNTNIASRNNYDLNSPQSTRDSMLTREQPLINRNGAYESHRTPLYGKPTMPANTINQRPYNYNTNITPRNSYDLNSPQSTRDSMLTREQPLINRNGAYESHRTPLYGKPTMPANTINQRPYNYNTNIAPRNNYNLNRPQYTRDSMLTQEQPLINKNGAFESNRTPLYGKPTMPANTINQRPYYPNQAQPNYHDTINSQKSAFNDILKNPLNTDPNKLTPVIEEQKSYENPQYVQTPKNIIGPPYPFERPSVNTYRPPMGLTTYRPVTPAARRAYNKNAPSDYDSFFHMPQKNTEAHARAIKEALQLIAQSKRAHQIINSVLKNKNNYGARNIFNNPGPLNSGK